MSRMLKQVISILLAAALLIPSSWLAPITEAAAPDTLVPSDSVMVYHENFVSGKGLASQSGSASLTPVTDKVFAGNADADVIVPSGAQAYLQMINSYKTLASVNYEAGKAISLTEEFTVDTSKDTTLRVLSDEIGKAVPFYIGDVLITEKKSSNRNR